jgi:hypothetical protein
MKPHLDKMTDMIIGSLSGEAKAFYEKEFAFFNEVTSISGKLRPFIKKTKPEKKVWIVLSMLSTLLIGCTGEDRRRNGQNCRRSWRLPAQ